MKITFLIGNGFDLNLGLATNYADFIKWYLEQKSENSYIEKEFKAIVRSDLKTWAEAEFAFGQDCYKFKDTNNLRIALRDFESQLARYLDMEARKIEFDYVTTEKSLATRINVVESLLKNDSKEVLRKYKKNRANEVHTYSFISFNYTKLFDEAIDTISPERGLLSHYNTAQRKTIDKIDRIIHVHGTTENGMIFGVDNDTQINKDGFIEEEKIDKLLVKPEINKRIKNGNDRFAQACINESAIIGVYGMSIGQTDARWWDRIVRWLVNNKAVQLILFVHEDEYGDALPMDYIDLEEEYENRLFKYSDVSENDIDEARNRIHVVVNKNPFPVKVKSENHLIAEKV